jgi:hypothetical protein
VGDLSGYNTASCTIVLADMVTDVQRIPTKNWTHIAMITSEQGNQTKVYISLVRQAKRISWHQTASAVSTYVAELSHNSDITHVSYGGRWYLWCWPSKCWLHPQLVTVLYSGTSKHRLFSSVPLHSWLHSRHLHYCSFADTRGTTAAAYSTHFHTDVRYNLFTPNMTSQK